VRRLADAIAERTGIHRFRLIVQAWPALALGTAGRRGVEIALHAARLNPGSTSAVDRLEDAALVGLSWLPGHPNGLGQQDRGVGARLVGVVAGVLLPTSLDRQPGVSSAADRVAADGHPQGGGVGRTAANGKTGQQIPVAAAMLGVTKPSSRTRTPARV
jgi:hypothetical protein